MAKIFSILTLVVAALAAYLGLESEKRTKELQDKGQRVHSKLVVTLDKLKATEAELATTKEKLAATEAELATTKENLRTTQEKLKTTETELTAKNDELKKVQETMGEMSAMIEELFPGKKIDVKDLKAAITELKTAITELSNKSKEQETMIGELTKQKASLEADKVANENTIKDNQTEIAKKNTKINRWEQNIMQKGIRGRVMAVNAGWGFCVLSIGDKQGAAANKILVVTRGGQSIGRVKITNVEASQSVADILPNTFVKGTYVQPGDGVIYTAEDKVNTQDIDAAPNGSTAPAPPLPTNAGPL